MVVKSQSIAQHVADLEDVFGEIYKYYMRLNSEKCTFGVNGGKFLGFMITHREIKANLDKCTTLLKMYNPTSVQEIQKLNSKLASLSRFLLKLTKKVKPFYKLLRKTEPFLWDEACKQAFLVFKKTITTPSILSKPRPGAPLLLYLTVADKVVSSTLVQEEGLEPTSWETPGSHLLHQPHTP